MLGYIIMPTTRYILTKERMLISKKIEKNPRLLNIENKSGWRKCSDKVCWLSAAFTTVLSQFYLVNDIEVLMKQKKTLSNQVICQDIDLSKAKTFGSFDGLEGLLLFYCSYCYVTGWSRCKLPLIKMKYL